MDFLGEILCATFDALVEILCADIFLIEVIPQYNVAIWRQSEAYWLTNLYAESWTIETGDTV